jgi:hypothetical protein
MKKKIYIFSIFLLFGILKVTAQTEQKVQAIEESAKDFKESKFLQVDAVSLPPELKKIEDEIKQNLIDVIIHSRTHTPMFSQKREEGYSESYKKFHGLNLEISPIVDAQDFYYMHFFYYNWTTNKFDKKLTRRISKYNVLNEIRFALYELLISKEFVKEHKDEIDKQNFDRIQDVREAVSAQKKNDKKERLENILKEEKKLLIEENKKKKKLLREERGKKADKIKQNTPKATELSPSKKNEEDDSPIAENNIETAEMEPLKIDIDENNRRVGRRKSKVKEDPPKVVEVPPEPLIPVPPPPDPVEPGEPPIPTKSTFYLFGSYFDEYSTATGLIQSTTNLRYVGFGARFIIQELTEKPRGIRFTLRVGMPVLKQNYEFPVYRTIESEIYRAKIFKIFQLFGGIDFSPNYFVNLPGFGEHLQVFENDFTWLKAGLGVNFEIFGHETAMRVNYLKSLMMSSNQKKTLTGDRLNASIDYQLKEQHYFEIAYQQSTLVGELEVLSKGWLFSYILKLEN